MKRKNGSFFKYMLIVLTCILLSACGGGGDSGGGGSVDVGGGGVDVGGGGEVPVPPPLQQQQAVVTLGISGGFLGDVIGAVDLVLTLPNGFVLPTDPQGILGEGIVSISPELLQPTAFDINSLPADASGPGEVQIGIIAPEGFDPDTLIVFTTTLASGTSVPASSDFHITLTVYDMDGAPLGAYQPTLSVSTNPVSP